MTGHRALEADLLRGHLRAERQVVRVRVEVPWGSFRKRAPDGSTDFVAPVPSAFTYGSVVGAWSEGEFGQLRLGEVPDAPDGEPPDALLLGTRLPFGHEADWPVWGVVRFDDGGARDDKLVCGLLRPTRHDRARITRFFRLYALGKQAAVLARGRAARVRFLGVDWDAP